MQKSLFTNNNSNQELCDTLMQISTVSKRIALLLHIEEQTLKMLQILLV